MFSKQHLAMARAARSQSSCSASRKKNQDGCHEGESYQRPPQAQKRVVQNVLLVQLCWFGVSVVLLKVRNAEQLSIQLVPTVPLKDSPRRDEGKMTTYQYVVMFFASALAKQPTCPAAQPLSILRMQHDM